VTLTAASGGGGASGQYHKPPPRRARARDTRNAVGPANTNRPRQLDGPARAYTIDANDQLKSADEYRAIIVPPQRRRHHPGDIADVIDDAETQACA